MPEVRQPLRQVGRRVAAPRRIPFARRLRVGRPPPGLPVVPRLAGHRAALARVGEGVARLRGHGEARVGVEPEAQLGGGDLLGPERSTVRLGRAGLGRCRPADDRAHAHERRAVLLGPRRENRRLERVDVVGVVDRQRVPAVGREAGLDVFGREGEVGRAVDRDPVVVVEVDEPPQAEVPGQRGGLGADALHQVAVGAEREDVVVADVVAVAVAQEALGHGHPDAVGESLPQRPGRRLDAEGRALGVPGRARAPLAEALELGQREVVAGQVQDGVQEHRPVAGREHEAVAVGPVRRGRVVLHHPCEQHVGGGRHGQREPGMAGVGPLHGIHAEPADRGDRRGGELLPGDLDAVDGAHEFAVSGAGRRSAREPSPPRATAARAVTRW